MKVNNFTKISSEDFPAEQQDAMGTLGGILNPFLEQIVRAFDKGVDFDNLNQQPVTFTVELDGNGIPKASLELKSPLRTRPRGFQVIRVENVTRNGLFPTATPFVTFGLKEGNIAIQHIAGLPANTKFSITGIIIG